MTGAAGEQTLISVIVLNYNSKDVLEKCLASVLDLEWPRLEVVVVDNASTDGSADMVAQQFKENVHVIRRLVNSPTAGRNEGFRFASGDYILSLDNDIVLPDKTVLQKAMEVFSQYPKVGLLAFKIGTTDNPAVPLPEHWWYSLPMDTWKDRFFYTDFFCEGAALFRSNALKVTGGYDDYFFQGFESVDLALRLIRDGFEMLYCPVLTCCELRTRGFLTSKRTRINYLSLRNRLWIVWKHYPFWRGCRYALGRIGIAGLRSVRYGWMDHFVWGVRDGIAAPREVRTQRKPLSNESWNKIRKIRSGLNPVHGVMSSSHSIHVPPPKNT